MFIVFYRALFSLFTMFCFHCCAPEPCAEGTICGSMITIVQACKICGPLRKFIWRSQPLVLGKYPAGNIMTSFGMLMSGVNINQTLLMFKHVGLPSISRRTFCYHQRKFHFPMIQKVWNAYQDDLLKQIKQVDGSTWSGDGRFDSMGHSTKYGTYSLYNNNISKIAHFELLQVQFSHILKKIIINTIL